MNRIGVLRGGNSAEYHFSIQTGAEVQRALLAAGFEAVDMLLDRDGILHVKGIPTDIGDAKNHVDMVWNALHGSFGEDGTIQHILDLYDIPYTGSDAAVSQKVFNKQEAKKVAASLGIATPLSMLIVPDGTESVSETAQRIYRTMAPPWVIKPLRGGGSAQSHFAFTALDLAVMVEESITHAQPFLVEQYIYGRESAVGTISDFRGSAAYVLPVVEVASPTQGILHHDMRSPSAEKPYARVRGGFTDTERQGISELAKQLHEAFGVSDYAQSEFITDKQGKHWFLETDTHPHLHTQAPFALALDAVGSSLKELAQSIIARKKQE